MSKPMVDSEITQRRLCRFSGRVQGVGFRYTAQNIAMRHNVTGYVKNLSDGRVELLVEGTRAEVEYVVQSIKQRMAGYVQKVDESESAATGEFPQFSIRHC